MDKKIIERLKFDISKYLGICKCEGLFERAECSCHEKVTPQILWESLANNVKFHIKENTSDKHFCIYTEINGNESYLTWFYTEAECKAWIQREIQDKVESLKRDGILK